MFVYCISKKNDNTFFFSFFSEAVASVRNQHTSLNVHDICVQCTHTPQHEKRPTNANIYAIASAVEVGYVFFFSRKERVNESQTRVSVGIPKSNEVFFQRNIFFFVVLFVDIDFNAVFQKVNS